MLDTAQLSHLPHAVLVQIMAGPAWFLPSEEQVQATANTSIAAENAFVMAFSLAIATISLAARSYTKAMLIKRWDWEDTLLILAWILIIVFSIGGLLGVQYGLCKHMWNIQVASFYQGVFYINWCAITYCVVVLLIKVAICLQYIRIFIPSRTGNKPLLYTCYVTIGLVAVFYTIITIMTICMCNPREAYWNPFVQGTCFDWALLAQVTCIFTIISDVALLIIPIFPVAKLHMASKKKLMIGLLFALGFIDCFAAAMRTYYTWQLTMSPDISWNISLMGMWTWVEMSFGILVACLPVCPRFYKHFKQRSSWLIGSSSKKTSASTDSYPTQNSIKVKTTIRSTTSSAPRDNKTINTGDYYELESPSKTDISV